MIFSCNCNDKDDFGIVTLHFEGDDNKLDINLRDFVYYDEKASYKCRLNVFLSYYDEFVVGLKGLNNTRLSFNMKEKKISFFHKIKKKTFFNWTPIMYIIVVLVIIIIIAAAQK